MKNFYTLLLIVFPLSAADFSRHEQKANEVAMLLLKTLKTKLTEEMTKGGPIKALEFCSLEAVSLTKDVNSKVPPSWTVKRISDRTRNSANAPDSLDLEALKHFDKSKEVSFWIEEKGSDSKLLASRYYKPIRIEATCLHCHGTTLSTVIKEKLAMKYPEDKATGYQIGQLRGLVRVRIPEE